MSMHMKMAVGACGLLVAIAGCDPEVIIYEKQPEKRTVGSPCVIDTECGSGRCSAGVCVVNECETDADCRDGEICNPLTHTCEPVTQYACAPGMSPILQLDQTSISFGTVIVGLTQETTLRVNNIGDCLLTVAQAAIDENVSDDEISCANCGVAEYPKSVPPGHYIEIAISFAPDLEQAYGATLVIRADDPSLTNGVLEVPISGEGLGNPRISIDPALIDFGNVQPNDPAVDREVTVTNVGAGELKLTRVFIDPPVSTPMAVTPTVEATGNPISLVANQSQVFTITYDPSSLATTNAVLFIMSNDDTRFCAADPNNTPGVGCVELKGDSHSPPVISVSATSHDFGDQYLGAVVPWSLVISNLGGSDLNLMISMGVVSSTDFRYQPPATSIVAAGGNVSMNVYYEPAQLGRVTGSLILQSNDPNQGMVLIGLSGTGLSTYANDVLKFEMTYENGDSGFFGDDYRDVDLYVENNFGEIVDKASCPPNTAACPDWTHPGMGSDQFNYGHPVWSAIGVAQEPERVILFDAHEDARGSFKACVTYREDCASIPSELIAALLGISVSVLISGLTEGIINPDAGTISDFIANNCWDHSSSRAHITTFVNGSPVDETSVSLGSKGDSACPVTVQRLDGRYCWPGAPAPCPQ
ncbi:MAG: choice-of-anchor D domain-containing protein [Deltaproteobacteria bacterium]|nr:choice-of-anchor D domain-containing protein [Deltaproteobacteria bacterium]